MRVWILILLAACGCGSGGQASLEEIVKAEGGRYRILAIYPQAHGVLISMEGMTRQHRTSVYSNRSGQPIPLPGEIWLVEYKPETYSKLWLQEKAE